MRLYVQEYLTDCVCPRTVVSVNSLDPLACAPRDATDTAPNPVLLHNIREKLALPLTHRNIDTLKSPPYTDHDHHPYTRFFRGVYDSPRPVIHPRHAGYRPTNDHVRLE